MPINLQETSITRCWNTTKASPRQTMKRWFSGGREPESWNRLDRRTWCRGTSSIRARIPQAMEPNAAAKRVHFRIPRFENEDAIPCQIPGAGHTARFQTSLQSVDLG